MSNLKTDFFSRDADGTIRLNEMTIMPEMFHQLRKNFYLSTPYIHSEELSENAPAYTVDYKDNRIISAYHVTEKTFGENSNSKRTVLYFEPNKLAENLLSITIKSHEKRNTLIHPKVNLKEYFALIDLSDDKQKTFGITTNGTALKNQITPEFNSLQASVYLNNLLGYEPKNQGENDLKFNALNALDIKQLKSIKPEYAQTSFDKLYKEFCLSHPILYANTKSIKRYKIKSALGIKIQDCEIELDSGKTTNAYNMFLQSLPSSNQINLLSAKDRVKI